MSKDSTDRDQWRKLNKAVKQLNKHEKKCAKRSAKVAMRLRILEQQSKKRFQILITVLSGLVGTVLVLCVTYLVNVGGS